MKTQRTTRYLLCVALLVALLSGNSQTQAGQYGPSFFEDFSDGNMTDGLPVNWLGVGDQEHSGYTLTPEGLKLGSATAADRDGTPYIYRDVSVRVQIKRTSNHSSNEWESGLVCRWGGPTGGYWIEVRPPNRFWIGHMNRYVLRTASLPFDVDERELIIRVDAIGDQIKCWCWPADEPMPEEPQISLVDDVTPDGTFALYAGTQGGQAIYRWVKVESLEVPIVDFNGDGTVDIKDLLKMIRCWGQNEPSADLSGNGTVGEEDLEVLMSYWGQEVNDATLIAHWALDEPQGSIACDSVGVCDAVLLGKPVWKPDGGQIGGALQLDGVDDFGVAPFVLSPAAGPFSVLAWVRGGAPGQAVISQANGTNWLRANPANDGRLMTELTGTGRDSGMLCSQAVITDGDWHRVALTWDGTNRALYVDDVLVAEDVQADVGSCSGGLNIGCGRNADPGTFWSGLIDEVRIYNRAVKP